MLGSHAEEIVVDYFESEDWTELIDGETELDLDLPPLPPPEPRPVGRLKRLYTVRRTGR